MPAKKFIIPFAATGDKTAVPNTLQPDGTVSYAQGFGPDYELDKTLDPINAKDVPRDQTNQLYFDLTDAVGEQQLYGVALWGADRAPYPLNARAYHNDKLWRSSVINNSGEPGVSGWDDISVSSTVVLANPGRRITPDGLIEQWGVSPVIAPGTNVVITLPLTFPAAHLGVTTGGQGSLNSTTPTFYGWEPISNSQFRIYNQSTSIGLVNWRAWGH